MKLSSSPDEQLVLRLEQRKSFSFAVVFRQQNGKPVDITGATLTLDFLANLAKLQRPEEILPIDIVTVAATILEPAFGAARFNVQADDLALAPGNYPYTITLRTAAGYSLVVAKGEIELQLNVEHDSQWQTYPDNASVDTLDVTLRGRQVVRLLVGAQIPPKMNWMSDEEQAKLALIRTTDGTIDVDLTGYARITDTTAWDAAVLAAAQTHADTVAASEADAALVTAQDYADTTDALRDAVVLAAAKAYAETQDDAQIIPTARVSGTLPLPQIPTMDLAHIPVLTQAKFPHAVLLTTEDLDAVVTKGIYHQSQNANATSGRNYPVAFAGMLEVFQDGLGNFIYQRYTTVSAGGNLVFTRGWYNGTWWSAWRVVSDGLAQTARSDSYQSSTGALVDTNPILQQTWPAAAVQTIVMWTYTGHCGYPGATTTIRMALEVTNATLRTSSAPQDMGVSTSSWISAAEGGSVVIPAGATGSLLLRARVTGGQYAYWRGAFNWTRSYWP